MSFPSEEQPADTPRAELLGHSLFPHVGAAALAQTKRVSSPAADAGKSRQRILRHTSVLPKFPQRGDLQQQVIKLTPLTLLLNYLYSPGTSYITRLRGVSIQGD